MRMNDQLVRSVFQENKYGIKGRLTRVSAATSLTIVGKIGFPSGQRDWFVPILLGLAGFVFLDWAT